ncbi:MAG: M20 family metallopeptidase [Bacteroidota bacterium]
MTDRGEHILSYLQEHKEEFVELLRRLTISESPTSNPDTLNQPFAILESAFHELDYQTLRLPGVQSGGQLYARPQTKVSGSYQMLVGHCDTVWPVGTLKEMPFEYTNNTVSGPGTYDMKAGLTMIIFALRALKSLGLEPSLTPVIFINSDEETGSGDSLERIKRLARCAQRALILEPSLGMQGKIKTQRKGVGHFDITLKGKPSHAGLAPDEGISAIHGLSHVVQQLFALNNPEKGITVNVGTISGGERSNVVAAESKAAVDVRVVTPEDGLAIEEAIRSLTPSIDGLKLTVKGGFEKLPMSPTDRNQKLWQKAYQLGKELDLELESGLSGGASDGNTTSQYTATLDGLGAVGEGAHAYHEKIKVEETLQRCALLALLLLAPA